MQLERASRLTVEFDGVSWALCHERTPFVEMALIGISLTNLRNRDQSGESAHCTMRTPAQASLSHQLPPQCSWRMQAGASQCICCCLPA